MKHCAYMKKFRTATLVLALVYNNFLKKVRLGGWGTEGQGWKKF